MTKKGRDKLEKNCWTIIRKDDMYGRKPGIKEYNEGSWILIGRYPTKAARDREFNRLLEKHFVIED